MSAALKLLQTLLTLLPSLITAAINSVHAIETGFQSVADATGNKAAKTGAAKLTVIESSIKAIYDTESQLASAVPASTLQAILGKLSGIAVTAFNTLGWFKSTTPPATPQP